MLDMKSWAEARRECNLLAADLATINSQPVQDLLNSIIGESKSMSALMFLLVCSTSQTPADIM